MFTIDACRDDVAVHKSLELIICFHGDGGDDDEVETTNDSWSSRSRRKIEHKVNFIHSALSTTPLPLALALALCSASF